MRVLIIRTDRIGDMILTLPMATAIKQASREYQVVMLARPYTKPLIDLCPDVDEIVLLEDSATTTTSHKPSAFTLAAKLRRLNVDAVIIPSPKPFLAFAALLSGIKLRIGTAYRWYSFCFNKKIYDHRRTAEYNEAEYNIRMLNPLGITPEKTPLPVLKKDSIPTGLLSFDRYIILHTRTGGSAPSWGQDHWVKLATILTSEFQLPIVLTGVAEDTEFLFILAERMKQAGADVHIQTENSLLSLAGLLEKATVVIAGSTGPGHLAAALGTPTIGLFPLRTVLSKERWGFRGEAALTISPQRAPKAECPSCRDCTCITEITPDEVSQAVKAVLESRQGK